MQSEIQRLNEERMRVWNEAQAVLDRAVNGRREQTAEEKLTYDRANRRLDELDAEIREKAEQSNRELRDINPWATGSGDAEQVMRDFVRGDVRAFNIDLGMRYAGETEMRLIAGDSGGGGGSLTVPSLIYPSVFQKAVSAMPMYQMNTTKVVSPNGAPLAIPTFYQGAGTQIATSNTVYAGTDPTVGSINLNVIDVGELVAIGGDFVEDSGINVLQVVSDNIGRALGTKVHQFWVTSSTGNVTGVMAAAATGSAGTIATGGSLILGPAGQETEKLIDLVYSINSTYRAQGSFLFNDSTTAKIRKLRDGAGGTAGQFVWRPSPSQGIIGGEPDTLLGYPCYSSADVATMGSANLIGAFGDFSAYYTRTVGGIRIERSDDIYFDKRQVALRGLMRIGGGLADKAAINYLNQVVT